MSVTMTTAWWRKYLVPIYRWERKKKTLRDLMNTLKAVLKVKELGAEPQVLDTIWH